MKIRLHPCTAASLHTSKEKWPSPPSEELLGLGVPRILGGDDVLGECQTGVECTSCTTVAMPLSHTQSICMVAPLCEFFDDLWVLCSYWSSSHTQSICIVSPKCMFFDVWQNVASSWIFFYNPGTDNGLSLVWVLRCFVLLLFCFTLVLILCCPLWLPFSFSRFVVLSPAPSFHLLDKNGKIRKKAPSVRNKETANPISTLFKPQNLKSRSGSFKWNIKLMLLMDMKWQCILGIRTVETHH